MNVARKALKAGLCVAVRNTRRFDPAQSICVFSDPRGGSTWITEVLAQLPRTAVLFEPLHIGHVPRFRRLGFAWRQYIPESGTWPEAERGFDDLFSGKILNRWTCSYSSPRKFFLADRMIVKFCRANAMIPWLTKRYAFERQPVYLLRHPFAVVASQLTHGAWGNTTTRYVIPDCRFNEFYTEHADFLSSLRSQEEVLVATWCLTNRVPLNSERNDRDWITVHYENLISNPQHELTRIFGRWQTTMPEAVLRHVDKPSFTTKDARFQAKDVETQLSKWKAVFNEAQIARMMRVMQYFAISMYDEGVFPNETTAGAAFAEPMRES